MRYGEVHALVGENGAGKSTLIKILSGAHPKDAGEIHLEGQRVEIRDPPTRRARHSGDLPGIQPCPTSYRAREHLLGSIAEALGGDRLAQGACRGRAILDRLGVSLPMDVPVAQLTVAEQQLVEIAKALGQDSKLMIMDEPSAVLGDRDLDKLFAVIRMLKEHGEPLFTSRIGWRRSSKLPIGSPC